jgi:ArsR family transcriptional regulator, virulence genes transcriptional regulator
MAKKAAKSKAPKFSKAEVSEIKSVLHVIASERRLILFIEMIRSGEATVTSLAEAGGLSQSGASQHLGRDAGLVSFRRDGQTLWYRIADARVQDLIKALSGIVRRRGAHPPRH